MKFARYSTLAFTAVALSMSFTASASEELAQKNNCLACHAIDKKILGPSYKDIAAKYKDDASAAEMLMGKIKNGGGGVWGQIPMPPNPAVKDEDLKPLVEWVLSQ